MSAHHKRIAELKKIIEELGGTLQSVELAKRSGHLRFRIAFGERVMTTFFSVRGCDPRAALNWLRQLRRFRDGWEEGPR